MRDFWRTAAWLNRRRLNAYPKIFLTLYAITIALYLALSSGMVDPLNRPVGTDFMNVWAAGKMADEGRAAEAYDWNKHRAVQNAALPWHDGVEIPYYGWHYPPMFLMVAGLLALLPYGGALLAWMAVTLPLYVAAVRKALPTRESVYLALAFPAVLINLGHGQNGFITAALIGGGVMLLGTRPYLAGVLFGLLAYKPQFGILIPVALLMGWHWRAIYAAGITVVLTALASYKFFGEETWLAFLGSLKLTRGIVLEQGSTGWEKIQSIFSVTRMWGGSVELAYAAQGIFALVAAMAVAWAWKQKTDIRLQGAVLVTASLLATPYILDYDLVALALPVAWMAACGMEKGFRPWEKTLLMAVFLLPLLSRSLGMLYLPPGPFVMMLLLVMTLRRIAYKN
jgi:hypothetical protein